MSRKPLRLPWTLSTMPHGVLDIIRGCNISCRACYNTRPAAVKPLELIRNELELLLRSRRLHTVTISGGEATLHPKLCEVVKMVKEHGLRAVLITNGLLIKPNLLARLKNAGLEMVMVHIDSSQRRADLPADASLAQMDDLRRRKGEMIASAGLNAGLAATLFRTRPEETLDAVDLVLRSPHFNYLLATNCTQFSRIGPVGGDLHQGLTCMSPAGPSSDDLASETLTAAQTASLLEEQRGLRPFAYLGSNSDPHDPRWYSYTIAVLHGRNRDCAIHPLAASGTEWAVIRLIRWLTGRYLFYQSESPGRFRLQLLANALTGGNFLDNVRFLARSLAGGLLQVKHLVFQTGPTPDPTGSLVHCLACPDATVRDGHVVPSCLADKVDYSCQGKGATG